MLPLTNSNAKFLAISPNLFARADPGSTWAELTIATDPDASRYPTMFRIRQCLSEYGICTTNEFAYVDLITVSSIQEGRLSS